MLLSNIALMYAKRWGKNYWKSLFTPNKIQSSVIWFYSEFLLQPTLSYTHLKLHFFPILEHCRYYKYNYWHWYFFISRFFLGINRLDSWKSQTHRARKFAGWPCSVIVATCFPILWYSHWYAIISPINNTRDHAVRYPIFDNHNFGPNESNVWFGNFD